MNAVNLPAPLVDLSPHWVVEIFVLRFQEFKIRPVISFDRPLLIEHRPAVAAEEDPILVLDEEFPGRVGLAPEFRQARADFHIVVRIRIEQARDLLKVIGIIAHVGRDKDRLRMVLDHMFSLFQQIFPGREARAVKAPLRIPPQFFVPLVEAVDRTEERWRVADVPEDGDP